MGDDHSDLNGASRPVLTRRSVDSMGRLVPISDEERKARLPHLLAGLDDVSRIPADETDTDEIWDQVLRNLGMDPSTGGPLES